MGILFTFTNNPLYQIYGIILKQEDNNYETMELRIWEHKIHQTDT